LIYTIYYSDYFNINVFIIYIFSKKEIYEFIYIIVLLLIIDSFVFNWFSK